MKNDTTGVYDSKEHREIDQRTHRNGGTRKRASSNYFVLDANEGKTDTTFRLRTSFLNLCNEGRTPTQGNVHDDEEGFNICCDYLGKRYGFQTGSIENQKEHMILLATNYKARYANPRKREARDDEKYYLKCFHQKLFMNYHQWCEFLHIKPNHFQQSQAIGHPEMNVLYMDIAMYFLIWGEAANIRHMPECICYLYHQMLELINTSPVITQKNQHGSGSFLEEIIRPIWKQCAVMLKKDKHGKQLEHTRLRNYDDNNEFFWMKSCLSYSPYNVGRGLEAQGGKKTFYEHRSLTSLLLNYYRIFQFNITFFVILTVIAFMVTISPSGGKSGFSRFATIGQVVQPFTEKDKNLAIASVFMTHAFLAFAKCLLELAHGWHVITSSSKENVSKEDSDKSGSYILFLAIRFLWNGLFSFLFGAVVIYPNQFSFSVSLYNSYIALGIVFILPGLAVLIAQTTASSWLVNTSAAKYVREGETCYVGRHMQQGYYYVSQYVTFWILLWIAKALVSFFLLIGPLMLPSIVIYHMELPHRTNIVSFNNIGIIVSLWLPVFCVFLYDTQIYFTFFQAFVGGYKGIKMKSGEFRGIQQISNAFRVAPQLFDQKIVSKLARLSDQTSNTLAAVASQGAKDDTPAGGNIETFQSQLMLRFVVVWNEIVNSFREGDLVDDKEAAILQYDIQSTGEVFEPVFLSAGKCGEAITMAIKLAKTSKLTDSELRIFLVQNDCLSAIKSFFNAITIVVETLLSSDDIEIADGIRLIYEMTSHGSFMKSFNIQHIIQLRTVIVEFLEAILDLPDPDTPRSVTNNQKHQDDNEVILVHSLATVRNFVSFMDNLLHALQQFCLSRELSSKFNTSNISFLNSSNNYSVACYGLLNLFHSDVAMGAATRAYLLLSLEKQDSMPRCTEARRRLGFFMKSLFMDIPQVHSISEMHSFSVMTPYYSETVIFSLKELNNPLDNHPIFKKVEEGGKNITILKYLTTCYPVEWENFLERIDVANIDLALEKYPQELRLWASYRGQTLARTVQGMMLYEDAIKILHWLEIGSSTNKSTEEKQTQLEDMVKLKFSYICACQVYGKQRKENKQEADDIDFLLMTYPNLRVAYVDTIPGVNGQEDQFDTVLVKAEMGEIAEVYRYRLPGNPVLGEGKPENQNNAIPFSRGEYLQTIDMNQQHYFEECLKMPQLLETADFHPMGVPVSIIGMREHIFTGNASSLAKFKTWQELVFVTLSQRVLAEPLCVRMHYGHPDVFDKILTITRGGVSKASKGINLSEDVYAGYNMSLRGGTVSHVEFMQCGKGRDVALSQISMFEAKLANGSGETSLSREAHRMGQFYDFFRLNSMYYSHTGFYFATWLTIVTTFVYMYCKLYVALTDVQEDIVFGMNSTKVISMNWKYGFDQRLFEDYKQVGNSQYLIQAGLILTLPLLVVYFTEMGLLRGMAQFLEMVFTLGPAFFIFQVGTTAHYFDNNLLHGGAKYQATGRGFKITRESFVLLYKAYCHSHYKKAFELVGLCLIYLVFGNFKICDRSSSTSFGHKFCSSGQSFGSQTFAIWFIAVIWILAPFIFNTDGLDWAKTCADIASWSKWMFMNGTEEDEDKVNTGGWVTWWKNDLDNLKTTKNVARLSVILREFRHFIVLWYVVTLKFSTNMVFMVLLGAILSFVIFSIFGIMGLAFHFSSHDTKKAVTRASIYLVLFFGVIIAFFVIMGQMFDWSASKCFALLVGYFAALYGTSEMLRVCNFSGFVIYHSYPVQQVAFFFDFLFGFLMLLPLFILSGIPFMNVIQTRMMYNEGFSKVMSASSQYAYSLAAYMGLLGGSACGWLLYVLTTLDSSPDFISYVTAYELNINAGRGLISAFILMAATCGTFVCGGLSCMFGRRINISFGGSLVLIGVVIIGAIPQVTKQANTALLYIGLGVVALGLGILMPMIWLYIYEISTKETRTKTMLLVCFGIVIGSLCGSYFTLKDKSIGWVWQLFQASVMVALVTPVINVFPESPLWVLQKRGVEAAQTCLAMLRRKQDVSAELKEFIDANGDQNTSTYEHLCGNETLYKAIISILLQITTSFSLVPISDYIAFGVPGADKLLLSQCIGLELIGLFLAFFFIDRISHRAVIISTFIPILLCVALLAINETKTFWKELVYTQIFASFLYLFQGLGIFSVCWVNGIGIYTSTNARNLFTIASFMIFFLIPFGCLYARLNLNKKPYYTLYAYACSLLASIILVGLSMSYRISDGTLCTADERRKEEKVARELRERLNHSGLRTPASARTRNLSRSRSKSQNRSNYHLYESPAARGKNVRVFA